MAVLWRWGFDKIVTLVVATLLNLYDLFMVVEGSTGIGKSTFAIQLALRVRREFKKLKNLDYETVKFYYEYLNLEAKGISYEVFLNRLNEYQNNNYYDFKLNKHLLYSKDDTIKFLTGFYGIGIPDEAINVAFNRDFFLEDQKNIVKLINMYRDHLNCIMACVPNFNVLDNQIKNLCKVRVSVVRRGIAIIQTPNKTFYGKDKWDTAYNEKIEREWLSNKGKKPQYTKLTTFRGLVKFSALPDYVEKEYMRIKEEKRNVILKDQMGIEVKQEVTVEDMLFNKLIGGGIKNMQVIEGVALANNISVSTLRQRLKKLLVKSNKNPLISSYFYNKRARKEGDHQVEGIV